LRPR